MHRLGLHRFWSSVAAVGLRTHIEHVSPERVRLSARRGFQLRVRGWVLGFVTVAGERRWHFGRFDEGFVVRDRRERVVVLAVGLTGTARRDVTLRGALSLTSPPPPDLKRIGRFCPEMPVMRVLSVTSPVAPKLVNLTRRHCTSSKHD